MTNQSIDFLDLQAFMQVFEEANNAETFTLPCQF